MASYFADDMNQNKTQIKKNNGNIIPSKLKAVGIKKKS